VAIKTYDPKQVAIIFGGIIVAGWSNVSVEYEEDAYEHSVGSDGEEMRTRKNDQRASMTLTLNQSSASNDALSLVAVADRATNGGVLPLLIKDNTGRSLVTSESAWIKKIPAFSREAGPGEVEWEFSLSNAIIFHGGH
jgi:hypothetical protein